MSIKINKHCYVKNGYVIFCFTYFSLILIIVINAFPDKWKTSICTLIHKIGNKCIIKNNRPIAVVCVSSKLFEQIIYKQRLRSNEKRIYSID